MSPTPAKPLDRDYIEKANAPLEDGAAADYRMLGAMLERQRVANIDVVFIVTALGGDFNAFLATTARALLSNPAPSPVTNPRLTISGSPSAFPVFLFMAIIGRTKPSSDK